MLTIAPLLILTVEVVLGQGNRVAVKDQIFPFDMANKSVDDKYDGCRKEMSDLVYTSFLKKEIDGNPTYKSAWEEGERNAKPPADNLTRNHSIAIYVYTSRKVYEDFNNAVRSGKRNYTSRTFKWYSLHFLLTEAIQILNETQKKCLKTYRRTKVEFDKDVLNKEVRFGSFASSTLGQKPKIIFGNVSCFEIETCEGADVANYSAHPNEKEVLIPPYEKFNVTDIKNNTWCKTVYVLKSSGTESDLNCTVASVKQKHHRFFSHNTPRILRFCHKLNSEIHHPLYNKCKNIPNQVNRGLRGLKPGYQYCIGAYRIGPHRVGTHMVDPHGVGTHRVGPHGVGTHRVGPHGVGTHRDVPHGFGPHMFCAHGVGTHRVGPHRAGPHAPGPDWPHGPAGPHGPDGLHGPRAQ